MSEGAKSIYKYSSELGGWMGLYLFLMSACLLSSVWMPTAILPLFPLVLGWPIVLYMLMRKIWRHVPAYRTMSAMWLSGICICIFGALICAALTAAWIFLFEPDFLTLYLKQCIDMASQANLSPQYAQMASQMRQMLESGHVPSTMNWVFSMIWLTAFGGAMLSLVLALIMTMRRSPNPEKFP